MLFREALDVSQVLNELQAAKRCTSAEAELVARAMGFEIPSSEMLARVRTANHVRAPGRPVAESMSTRHAVGFVAAYFEAVGARPEQAIEEARRWLHVALTRGAAKKAVATIKRTYTNPEQLETLARSVHRELRGGTQHLPSSFLPRPRRS